MENSIKSNFEFGVFDGDDIFRFGNRNIVSNDLIESPYVTRLFKNDLLTKPGYLKIYFPKEDYLVLSASFAILLTSIIIVFAIIYIFYWTVKSIIIQEKNSEIKNDFINNMTHELKTPIATISLAVEVLKDPMMEDNKKLLNRYLGMINEENKRLGMLVEEVLQSAALDKSAFKIKHEPVDISSLIKNVVKNMYIMVKEHNGQVTVNVDPLETNIVIGDQVHLTNMLYNLLGNAIKYSRDNPIIKIKIVNIDNYISISISDKGIGIAKEHLKKVFNKLYRVPTGNLHDVKGFGLGLNYVKTIVAKHNGTIEITSTLGKGSTFIVNLPKKISPELKSEKR